MSWFGQTQGLSQLAQQQAAIAAQQQAYLSAMGAGQAQSNAYNSQLAQYQTCTATTTTSASTNNIYFNVTSSGTAATGMMMGSVVTRSGPLRIADGHAQRIEMPDGTIIDVKADGSFAIEDKDAKVIYRAARMRDFNPFINVSDRLEEFIEFCGKQGVRQGEMLELPLNLFIGWLVVQAAKADKEPEPAVALLPDLRKRITPRCPGCGRFTLSDMRAKKIEFCAPECFERHYNRMICSPSRVPLLAAA